MNKRIATCGAFFLCLTCLSVSAIDACQREKPFPGELSGLDQSEAALIEDNRPLVENREVFDRLLFRAQKTAPHLFCEYEDFTKDISLGELIRHPKQYRGWVFRVRGVARQARWNRGAADQIANFPNYYEVDIELSDNQMLTVLACECPKAWLNSSSAQSQLSEPIEFRGFFAILDSGGASPRPIFVAKRISWYPTPEMTSIRSLGVGHFELAAAGFDLGLLDAVRLQNLKPITGDDTDAFYSMLAAAAGQRDFARSTADEQSKSFFDITADSLGQIGEAVDLTVRVRRVVTIDVDNQSQDFQHKKYYQLDTFFPLGDHTLYVAGLDGEQVRYQTRFPVTILAPKLATDPANYENQVIRVSGYYYRFWNFDTDFSRLNEITSGQFAPMIMANRIEIIPAPNPNVAGWFSMVVLACGLSAVAFVWLFVNRRERRKSQPNRGQTPPSKFDFH